MAPRTTLAAAAIVWVELGCATVGPGRAPTVAQTQPAAAVTFESINDLIVLPVYVNDHAAPLTFILDTGAPTALSRRTAQQLGIKGRSAGSVARDSAGRRLPVALGELSKVRAGGITVSTVPVAILDMAEISEVMCRRIDGLLGTGIAAGTGFLDHVVTRIDYDRGTIAFSTTRPTLGPDTYAVPLGRTARNGGRISVVTQSLIDVVMEGQPRQIVLDTGFNAAVAIPRHDFEALGRNVEDAPHATWRGVLSMSAGGWSTREEFVTRLRSFALGGLALRDTMVSVPSRDSEGILLGNRFLDDFVVTIDFPDGHLFLEPKTKPPALTNRDSVGFGWTVRDGRPVVLNLMDGSAAARSGMRIGDELVRLGDRNVEGLSETDVCAVKKTVDLSAPLRVTFRRDGKDHTVDLEAKALLPPPG